LKTGRTALVVTDSANRSKLDEVNGCPPVATLLAPEQTLRAGDIDWTARTADATPDFAPVMLRGDALMALLSTSGTTGRLVPGSSWGLKASLLGWNRVDRTCRRLTATSALHSIPPQEDQGQTRLATKSESRETSSAEIIAFFKTWR
jgi:hypothetical protein